MCSLPDWRAAARRPQARPVASALPGSERAPDHLGQGSGQDDDVAPQGPVLDVLVVVPGPGVDGRVAPKAVDLGPAREPDRKAVAIVVAVDAVTEPLDEEGPFGAGPDERHVALD